MVGRLPQSSTALAALAATISEQAVQPYRTLAGANPDAHLPDLADALTNLRDQLTEAAHYKNVAEVEGELASVLERMGDKDAESPS